MAKRKTKTPRQIIKGFSLDERTAAGLKALEKVTGKNMSEIIRSLIPGLDTVAVAVDYQTDQGLPKETVLDLFVGPFDKDLAKKMKTDSLFSLSLQVREAQSWPAVEERVVKLYRKYKKRLNNEEGYRHEDVDFRVDDTERKYTILVGPDDDFEALKKRLEIFLKGLIL